MKDFTLCFILTLKRYVRKKIYLCSILLIPICILLLGMLTEQNETEWKVALYTEESGTADAVCRRLMEQEGMIKFYQCASEKALKQAVLSKKAECGVVFREGFKQAVESFHFDDEVTIFYSPSSVAHKMVREEVFASTLSEVNEVLLTDFMHDFVNEEQFDRERLLQNYQFFIKDGNVFHFEYEAIPKQMDTPQELKIILSTVRGMLAVFIWAEILLSVLMIYMDEKNGIYKVMRPERRMMCQLCILGIPSVMTTGIALPVLYIAHGLYGLSVVSVGEELFLLAAYCILCILSAMCIYYCCRSQAVYVLLVTILLIAGVVLCPVFFSMQLLAPQLSMLQYILMPGAYLCRFLTGRTTFLWVELMVGAVWMIIFRIMNTGSRLGI